MQSFLFWSLLPLLAPQAIWVKHTARRFEDAKGPTFGSIAAPNTQAPTMNLLAIGDSIIAGVGARHMEKALVAQTAYRLSMSLKRRINWQALARTGANSIEICEQILPNLPEHPAEIILLSAGVNDITSLRTTRQWRLTLNQLLQSLIDHSPQSMIVFLGIPPMGEFPALPRPLRNLIGLRANQFNRLALREASMHPNIIYAQLPMTISPDSFSADGYHPSEHSYRLIAESLSDLVCQKLFENNTTI